MLVVPFIPMVWATIIAYVDDYFKLKNNNNFKYKSIKYILIILVVIGLFMLFKKNYKYSIEIKYKFFIIKIWFLS